MSGSTLNIFSLSPPNHMHRVQAIHTAGERKRTLAKAARSCRIPSLSVWKASFVFHWCRGQGKSKISSLWKRLIAPRCGRWKFCVAWICQVFTQFQSTSRQPPSLRWSYQLYGEDATINWTFWKRRAWRFENTRLWQDIWIKHFSSNFCKAVFAGFKIATITRGRRRHQGMPFTAGLRCLAGWKAMARFAAIIMNLVGYCSRSLCKLLRMI